MINKPGFGEGRGLKAFLQRMIIGVIFLLSISLVLGAGYGLVRLSFWLDKLLFGDYWEGITFIFICALLPILCLISYVVYYTVKWLIYGDE